MTRHHARVLQQGIHCTQCGDDIYSNTRHDLVTCHCEAWSIDGGFDHERIGGHGLDSLPLTRIQREVDGRKLPYRYREEVPDRRAVDL